MFLSSLLKPVNVTFYGKVLADVIKLKSLHYMD